MLKIRALNRESSSDEDIPVIRREAQEEIAIELYNKALRLQAEERYVESKSALIQLLQNNISLLENNDRLPKSMQNLKYSCYVNMGNINLKLSQVAEALEMYLRASELDESDVTLWYKIGKLSLQENKFRQSAYAFLKGLECSENHWPCLDQLISILFAIKDIIACLVYIEKALILDPNYMKGLVLRRQIYQSNPAAEEYYRLLNPNHSWEPPLDTAVDKIEMETILKEALHLYDHITEIEKSFGPKPLQTVPLYNPLEEHSWLSLARTVTSLHRYISDNNMSHFTIIDLETCINMNPGINVSEQEIIVEEKFSVEEESQKLFSIEVEPEPVDPVLERFSQNGEGNSDVEDQIMDQDNDEQEDNLEIRTERGRPRGQKRKRDLLSDLQIWGWHNKRKQSKKAKERDVTVEDAINRIIPRSLLPNKIEPAEKFIQMEDSMDTMDIYNLYVKGNNTNLISPINSPETVNLELYFGTDTEKGDVTKLWTKKRDRVDAVVLIKDLVFSLSKLWHYKWPKDLVPLYIEAFNMFREHCGPPELFCVDQKFEEVRNDALATLLYCELLSFSSETKQTVHPTQLGYLQVLSSWEDKWQNEYSSFFHRVFWLRSHLFQRENCNDLAVRALGVIQDDIEKKQTITNEVYLLSLPNCFKHGLITKQKIDSILKHLDLINSLGTVESLFLSKKYIEVAEIIKPTFKSNSQHHFQVGRLGRPAQVGLLLDSLWFTSLIECFIWTEDCIYESLTHFLKPAADSYKWEKIVEKCLAIFHEVIERETSNVIDFLTESKRTRLIESLSKIICKQLSSDGIQIPLACITPWILLHHILVREEHKQYVSRRINRGKKDKADPLDIQDKINHELPPSIAILFSAHEFLGPKGWCLTGRGELLHFILDTILDRLDTPVFERTRDKTDIHLEQALFCLYQHPSKKNKVSRHLADHNVDPLPLSWNRSFQLFEFYGPNSLPEFNSYKNASISADLEQLFKRIIALVPPQCAPQLHLPKIMDFIHGKIDMLPEPIDFPIRVRPIYYLIGDLYFKQREFSRCIKYFQMDLCINPSRVDSWACLALSYAAQLDAKLNHCEKFKSDTEFLDRAKYASICFKRALEIAPDPLILWIECGTFQYTVHSYCSRILKYESENLSMEKFEYLENQKNYYLDSSGNSFEKAIALYEKEETSEPDERWLQYYVLGKIAEKKQKEPAEYLQYYMTASNLLNENNAECPEKINYNNPQHLAVEALELHYRIHASVLKYLEMNEGKEISNTLGEFFNKCLNSSQLLKKTAVKIVPEAVPDNAAEPNVPNKIESNTPGNGLGFQEQFLHSLGKLSESTVDLPTEEQNENKKLEKSDIKEEGNHHIQEDNTIKLSEVNDPIKTDKVMEVETSEFKEEKENVTNNVIMISDSDEDVQNVECIAREEGPKTSKAVEKVKDVQKMLDEMMVQTMRETEQQENEIDSDLSGTEKVEEVFVKEVVFKEDEITRMKPTDSETNTEKKNEDKSNKMKPSDSETDTENIRTSVDESNTSSSSSGSSSESSDSESDDNDDSSSSCSVSSSEADKENMSSSELAHLVDKCVSGLELCIMRLTQNYKALYRLAHLYFNYKPKRDLTRCKQLLLSEYKCKGGTVVPGLFSERKANNFFNGIWRIPSTEIDRPGSLSAHMSRCITLLMNVLTTTNDTKILIDLCLNLRKTPEPDKIYIKDSDRMASSEQALTMCIQCLRSQIKNMNNLANPQIVKLLQEIFRVYQRLQRHVSGKELPFSTMLTEVYRNFIKEKIPDNVNILDLAVKFCLQQKSSEKPRPQHSINQTSTPPTPRGLGLGNFLVLPAPSKINPAPNIPLKRPGSGRPRGRPPLPKMLGQIRQPRSRTSNISGISKSYAWQKNLYDQSYAYEYLKHYQDELIKQYSQNLNLTQLAQLTQILTQKQIHNPSNSVSMPSQFLTQSGLLDSSALMKQLTSSSGNTSQISNTQLLDGLKQLNPNLRQKLGIDQVLSKLTADQLKFLGMTTTVMGVGNKTAAPHTVTSALGVVSSKTKTSTSHIKQNSFQENGQIFKEPNTSKPVDDKTSKDLMKERPSLSITPVSADLPGSSNVTFVKPCSNSSNNKTLQEKLAEKKKEQQSKEKKSLGESSQNLKALQTSFNVKNIPSSLTVCKSTVPVSSSAVPVIPTTNTRMNEAISHTSPNRSAVTTTSSDAPYKCPHDVSPSVLGPTICVFSTATKERSLSPLATGCPTPKFSVESGISVSQVPVNQTKSLDKVQVVEPSIEISPVKYGTFSKAKPFKLSADVDIIRKGSKDTTSKLNLKSDSLSKCSYRSFKLNTMYNKHISYNNQMLVQKLKPNMPIQKEPLDDDIICID